MTETVSSSQHGHYVQISDINMYYETYGDGEPLLLLHGGLGKPSMLGNSDGAQVILEMGMRYSELVDSLVFCAGGYTRSSEAYQKTWRNLGINGFRNVDFDRLQAALGQSTLEVWRKRHASGDSPDRRKQLRQQLAEMWLTPLKYSSEDFKRVKVPVLLMVGDRDQFFPVEEIVEMYRLLPSAELVILPNSDHGLPYAEIELCSRIILSFFQSHEGDGIRE